MNWFERYGIVGIYFVIFSFGWLTALFSNLFTSDKAQIIIAIGAGISLPIGYLLSIFSQDIYYSLPEKWQVHKTVRKKVSNLPNYDEKLLESNLVIIQRFDQNNDKLENLKWLQDYVRKRWDVFAINSSLMIATFFAWLPAIFVLIFIQSAIFQLDLRLILMLVFLSAIIIFILWRSRCLMFDQIVEVHTIAYQKLSIPPK